MFTLLGVVHPPVFIEVGVNGGGGTPSHVHQSLLAQHILPGLGLVSRPMVVVLALMAPRAPAVTPAVTPC